MNYKLPVSSFSESSRGKYHKNDTSMAKITELVFL